MLTDARKIKISLGNSKIGRVPNISLPPGKSCSRGARCYQEGCYAVNSYRLYPSVRKAWGNNWDLYISSPKIYFYQLAEFLAERKPKLFRFHVGGDFPGQLYLDLVKELASVNPGTKFLAFTKQYEYDYSMLPPNLNIVLSIWPSMALPSNVHSMPTAWLASDIRRPLAGMYLKCPGGCQDCHHKCWDIVSVDVPVFFAKH